MKKKALAAALTAVMLIPAFPMTASAVTGSTVAADGTYSGSASKIGTVSVTVSNGKITGLTCSKANKSSYKTLVNSWFGKINGASATYSTVDAVSAATSGKYGSGLKTATLAALKTAPAASGSSSGGSSSGGSTGGGSSSGTVSGSAVADGTYSGRGSSVGTITVTVSGGKIANVTCSEATKSSYQSLVTSWLNKIKGLTASYETIDAVSAATSGKYGSGLKSGTLAALSTASGSGTGGSSSGGTEEPWVDESEIGQGIGSRTGTKYTGTGTIEDEYVTLDVYVSNNKITGVFIAEEVGTWLSLLTQMQDSFLGATATSETIDAITSGTSLGFRDTLRNAVSNALKSAGGSGTEDPWVDESEIGQGIGSRTGTKYTGTGTIEDEYVTLDVYVSNGRITGVFIAKEVGTWLNLLTQMQSSFIGATATSQSIDAITSGTSLGFRDTLRNAVSDAVKSLGGSGSGSSTTTGKYKADGWDKEYSYNTLKNKQYYYCYQGNFYPITPVYDRKKGGSKPYAATIQVNGRTYYLDKADDETGALPTKWEGEKAANKKLYESAKADDDEKDKREEPQLYTLS